MEKKTIDSIEYDVYTMQDWNSAGTLSVKVGQLIEPAVFWQLLTSVPPHRYELGIFAVGEPYTHNLYTGQPLFKTFESMGNNYFKYVGLNP